MQVFHGFDALPTLRAPAVTVGSFDGVHLGHKALITALVAEARRTGGESVVVTFEPHPRIALGHAEGMLLLTTFAEKAALLEQLGVDHIVVIPFDKTFSALSGAEFVDRYILGRLRARTLVAGYNHRFGHDACDCEHLVRPELRIIRVDECNVAGEHVSSTVIRRLIAGGNTVEAERLSGHPLGKNIQKTQK